MIFVTVGTHEQQFDRLLSEIDRLVKNGDIKEEVIIQTGFSTYEPQYCAWKRMYPYQEMCQYIEQARIVITHGGPSTFITALQLGKTPIVVPRQQKFGEHVNDHQMEFGSKIAERQGNIILVTDIDELGQIICNYDNLAKVTQKTTESNNAAFCKKIEVIASKLLTNG